MAYRTCDLDDLASRVRALVGGRSCTVAVSGFPAAGKTTLARLLAERLEDAWVVHVDDLLTAEPTATDLAVSPDLPVELAAAHRSVLGDIRARRTGWLILEGGHLLHPDLRDLADVHVWLDVDHVRANGNAFMREVEECQRAGRPRPVATFSFGPPPPGPLPPSQQFFDVHRPDLTADVLFVPVGRMVPPVRVRFFSDYSDFVLWDDDNELLGELERLLPMPQDLRARIVSYAETGRDSETEGRRLCRELQQALGAGWDVRCLGG